MQPAGHHQPNCTARRAEIPRPFEKQLVAVGVAPRLLLLDRSFAALVLDEFFDLSTWLTAIIGAIVLLLIYRLVVGRRSTSGAFG